MTFFSKLASVFDALADQEDTRPPPARVQDPLLDRLEARVGSALSDDVRHKLAADTALRQVLAPLIEAPETPRALGGPSEKAAEGVDAPRSKEERRRAAEDRFAADILARRQH